MIIDTSPQVIHAELRLVWTGRMSSNIEPILEFPPSSFLSDFIIEKITVDGIDDSRTSNQY